MSAVAATHQQAEPKDPENFPFVVVGNKVDVENKAVSNKLVQTWCASHPSNGNPIPLVDTSAKDGFNVVEAFTIVARLALQREKENQFDLFTASDGAIKLQTSQPSSEPEGSCPC